MNTLLKDMAEQIPLPQRGSLAQGRVIYASPNKILVDLGPTGIGVVMGPELRDGIDALGKFKEGDVVSALVLIPENEEGYIELSPKNAIFQETWQELENKFTSAETINAEITEANKGGLIMKFRGILGFLPVSQLAPNHYPRVEGGDKGKIVQELKKLIKQNLEVKIIDLNRKEKRIIFSEKVAEGEALKKYKNGDVVEGEISGIVDFGVFVKIEEGIEGLVHISELAWQLIENPRDIVKIGDKVQVKIIEMNKDKISLSIKALQKDPWIEVEKKYQKGNVIEGEVTKFNPFGAFIALDKNIHGLCHISEFGTQKKMEEALGIGKKYKFKIVSIDAPEHRMALTLVKEETK